MYLYNVDTDVIRLQQLAASFASDARLSDRDAALATWFQQLAQVHYAAAMLSLGSAFEQDPSSLL